MSIREHMKKQRQYGNAAALKIIDRMEKAPQYCEDYIEVNWVIDTAFTLISTNSYIVNDEEIKAVNYLQKTNKYNEFDKDDEFKRNLNIVCDMVIDCLTLDRNLNE